MESSEKRTKPVAAGPRNGAGTPATTGYLNKIYSLYVVSLLVLAAIVIGFIWHDLQRTYRDTLGSWDAQLSSAAEARVRVMVLWRTERRRDIELIIRNPLTARLLSASESRETSRDTQQGVEKELEAERQSYGYLAGAALDRHCRFAAQAGIRPEMTQAVYDACQLVQPGDTMRVDGFGMERGHLIVIYSVPVNAEAGALPQAQASPQMLGVVSVVSDPWKDITSLIAFENSPTRSSETLIAWKNGPEAYVFSPRRSAEGVEAVFKRPLDGNSFESRVARECDVPFGEFIDYRGVRVLGAARRISATGDGLARKVDWDEALAPYRQRAGLDGLVGALSLLLLGSVILVQHRRATARDFQERFRQQEALRERDERLRSLFENATVGIYRTTPAGRILMANPALVKMLGYTCMDQLVERNLEERGYEPGYPRELFHERMARDGEVKDLEAVWRKQDGSAIFVRESARAVRGEGNQILYYDGFVEDITLRKRAEEELQRSFEQLRALAARLQRVREEERKRVAREIHDQLGQVLTAIKIDLSYSSPRDLSAGEISPCERTSSILQMVDDSIHTVRRIATELRPGILDDVGLVAALEWAGQDFQARTGTTCRLDLPQDEFEVEPEQATAIFRIFQETLTNVARHAEASAVDVRIAREAGDLTLEIHDNGKGITGDRLAASEALGILGMRERAMLLGGELTIRGSPGNGTTVRVRIPQAGRTT